MLKSSIIFVIGLYCVIGESKLNCDKLTTFQVNFTLKMNLNPDSSQYKVR